MVSNRVKLGRICQVLLQGLPVQVGVTDRAGQDPPQVRRPACHGALVEFVEVERYNARERSFDWQVGEPHRTAGEVLLPVPPGPAHYYVAGALGDGEDEVLAELGHLARDDEL